MSSKTVQLAEQIRDRLCERALSGSPQWLAPILPSARESAGALLIGNLTGKLPTEDESALVQAILREQIDDGSWPRLPGENGDLSVTLEVVQALNAAGDGDVRNALSRAVNWLELNRQDHTLDDETLILLGALAEMTPGRLRRLTFSLARRLMRRAHAGDAIPRSRAMRMALTVLSRDRLSARHHERELLEMQRPDGSWDGSARATVFALVALRHVALPPADAAFERGWRFLRSLQLWNHGELIQNPCDISVLLHSAAVHSLLTAGVETEAVTGSLLSLLHQQYANGTWGAGAWLPPDNFSTALSLDALSLAGDNPVETAWSRRRAALSLMRTQHANGGWSFFALPLKNFSFLLYRGAAGYSRGSIEVTAASLQALVYASVPDLGQDVHVARAMSFLTNRQDVSGLWPADLLRSRLLASALAMEALTAGSSASNTAVLRGVRAMLQRQRPDGGWSDHYDQSSSVHHTALVLRALAGIPGVPSECLHRARTFLEKSVDLSELMWSHAASPMYLPAGFGPRIVPELTSLWALEALVPVGIPDRPRPRHRWRSRSLFDRSR